MVGTCASTACVAPQAAYDDFLERDSNKLKPDPLDDGREDGAACTAPDPEQIAGSYLLSLVVSGLTLESKKPTVTRLDLDVSWAAEEGKLAVTFDGRALDAKDWTTPVGEALDPTTIVMDHQNFEIHLKEMELDARANPIINTPMVQEMFLSGTVCKEDLPQAWSGEHNKDMGSQDKLTFLCGTAKGELMKPLPRIVNEGEATWAAIRIEDDENYPWPELDCAHTEAAVVEN